jgi:hypothetical protein
MIQPGSGPAAASGGALFCIATGLLPALDGVPPTDTGPELAAVAGRAAATWVFMGGVFKGGLFTGGLFAGWTVPCRGVPG